MGKIKFLSTEPAVSGGQGNTFTKPIPAGRYSAVHVTLTGETVAGETLSLDDIGQVVVNHSQKGQLVRADMGFLNSFTQIKGGFPPTVSGEAESEERVVFRVPFGTKTFPNVQDVPDDNTLSIKFEFNNAMATRFGANAVNVRVDMIEELDVAQTYDLKLQSQNQQAQSSARTTDTISGKNLVALMVRDAGGVLSEVNLTVDGETVVDNTPIGVIRDETNIHNRVEASGQPWAEILVAENPVKESTENSSSSLAMQFSGAGTVDLYKFNFDWLSREQRQRNISKIDSFLARKSRS